MAYTLRGQEFWKEDKVCGLYKEVNGRPRLQCQNTPSLVAVLHRLEDPVAETTLRGLRQIAQEQYSSSHSDISSCRPYIQNTLDFCDEALVILQGN